MLRNNSWSRWRAFPWPSRLMGASNSSQNGRFEARTARDVSHRALGVGDVTTSDLQSGAANERTVEPCESVPFDQDVVVMSDGRREGLEALSAGAGQCVQATERVVLTGLPRLRPDGAA